MNQQMATFGGGCFWCTEAVFKRLKGVISVVSGYAGGNTSAGGKNPNYEQVSTGATGHAEAIQITFDPEIISYDKLLAIFFATHDPTTRNQQGADIGTQYRSVIFYHTTEQKEQAEAQKTAFDKAEEYSSPIVTEIVPYEAFYTAEEYHQNYYDQNPNAPYCQIVINPKIQKLLEKFNNEVKEEYK